jgi:hypothetical protein
VPCRYDLHPCPTREFVEIGNGMGMGCLRLVFGGMERKAVHADERLLLLKMKWAMVSFVINVVPGFMHSEATGLFGCGGGLDEEFLRCHT